MTSTLTKALQNVFEMSYEDAKELANTVKKAFHGEKEIEDMTIDKHLRSLFYELQRENLLKLRREEYKEKGKFIRKYYWSFNQKAIRLEAHRMPIPEAPYKIYEKIPKNAWLVHTKNT